MLVRLQMAVGPARVLLALPGISSVLFALAVTMLSAQVLPLHFAEAVDSETIRKLPSGAFVAPVISSAGVWHVRGSGVSNSPTGWLHLFEDLVALGPGNTAHEVIAQKGAGHYSHWGRELVFSSSDGSDPRLNGRIYSYRAAAQLRPYWIAIAAVALVAGLAGFQLRREQRTSILKGRLETAIYGAILAVGAALLLWFGTESLRATPTAQISIQPANTQAQAKIFLADECCRWPYRLPLGPVRGMPVTSGGDESSHAAVNLIGLSDGRFIVNQSGAADTSTSPTTFKVGLTVRYSAWLLALFLVAAGVAGIAMCAPTSSLKMDRSAVYMALLITFASLIAGATVFSRWMLGDSAFLGVAGFLPVSDAMGYFRCAVAVSYPAPLDVAGVSADWCARRILYPLSLSSLLAIAGFSPAVALLLQASIVGACIVVLASAVRSASATAVAIVSAALCAAFAYQWATANFMTEFLGFSAGLVCASLLLAHARNPSLANAAGGVAMLSVALTSRAGALFALPLCFFWAYFTTRPANVRLHVPSLTILLVSTLIGPAIQFIGAWQIGADLGNTGGNFSASLYGLSTGSRDWSEAYRTFSSLFQTLPEGEAFRLVQARALENMAAHPHVFLRSLYEAALIFFSDLFGFTGAASLNPLLTGFLVIGVVHCLLRWRTPAMSLILLVFAAEVLSAPFVIDSGGHRVFAATVWCRAILAGIGIWMCVVVVLRLLDRASFSSAPLQSANINRIATCSLVAVLAALVAFPMTPMAGLIIPPAVQSQHSCASGQFAAVVNFEAESMAVGVAKSRSLPLHGPLLVSPGRFDSDAALIAGWGNKIGPMPLGSWIMLVFDRQPESRGQLYSLFFQGSLPPSADGLYAICAGEVVKDRQLGDFQLRRIESIAPFTGR